MRRARGASMAILPSFASLFVFRVHELDDDVLGDGKPCLDLDGLEDGAGDGAGDVLDAFRGLRVHLGLVVAAVQVVGGVDDADGRELLDALAVGGNADIYVVRRNFLRLDDGHESARPGVHFRYGGHASTTDRPLIRFFLCLC